MKQKSLLISLFVVAILLAGFAGVAAAQSLKPAAQTDDSQSIPRTMTVVGHGKVSLTPDVAYIYLGVHTQGPDAKEAVAENNSKTQAVIDALVAAGIAEKDIQTTNFSIYPQQQYDDQGQPTGDITYMVDNTVYVTVRDLENIGDVLDAAIGAGANTVNGISFDVEDKTEGMSKARTDAVADAQAQAQELAAAAGVSLGDVLTISTIGAAYTPPLPYGKGGGGGAAYEAAAAVPISPGQMEITSDVTMIFEIQ
jgi:hypothetical protein